MVLRATFAVLCIVLSLALFSNSSEQENGWIWAAAVGVVVAGIVLGIEYTLRQAEPGVLLGGAAGRRRGPLFCGIAALGRSNTGPDIVIRPALGLRLLWRLSSFGLCVRRENFSAAGV